MGTHALAICFNLMNAFLPECLNYSLVLIMHDRVNSSSSFSLLNNISLLHKLIIIILIGSTIYICRYNRLPLKKVPIILMAILKICQNFTNIPRIILTIKAMFKREILIFDGNFQKFIREFTNSPKMLRHLKMEATI